MQMKFLVKLTVGSLIPFKARLGSVKSATSLEEVAIG